MQRGTAAEGSSAYRLYDGACRGLRYAEMLDRCAQADVVLFGEIHDHPVVHQLQLELTRDLYQARKRDLLLGAEMLEADDQLVIDEYLAGLIEHEHLVREAKVWGTYGTACRPLVDFAREHGLRFIATNIPRRYAGLVARRGMSALETLSGEARRSIAPLPIVFDPSAPGYRQAREIGAAHGPHMDPGNFVAAQAVKDATMAYFILKNRRPGDLFLHYNGDYHSKDYGGICWYLRRYDPDVTVRTISSLSSDSPGPAAACSGRADVIVVVPAGPVT